MIPFIFLNFFKLKEKPIEIISLLCLHFNKFSNYFSKLLCFVKCPILKVYYTTLHYIFSILRERSLWICFCVLIFKNKITGEPDTLRISQYWSHSWKTRDWVTEKSTEKKQFRKKKCALILTQSASARLYVLHRFNTVVLRNTNYSIREKKLVKK